MQRHPRVRLTVTLYWMILIRPRRLSPGWNLCQTAVPHQRQVVLKKLSPFLTALPLRRQMVLLRTSQHLTALPLRRQVVLLRTSQHLTALPLRRQAVLLRTSQHLTAFLPLRGVSLIQRVLHLRQTVREWQNAVCLPLHQLLLLMQSFQITEKEALSLRVLANRFQLLTLNHYL